MIEVRDLTKRYGDRLAIDRLSFTVRKGEVVGFLGPNGAGKSTTMKIITGFMAPSDGQVTVAGQDVFEYPMEVKQKIGYLPEIPPVYTDMYVRDYLRYVGKLKNVPAQKLKSAVEMAIEKTNLQEVQGRLIQNLSKGYKQRVGIAQALVSDPEILILDEPTVGLDPKQVAEVRKLIQQLRGYHTIVLSTHILPEVQAVCERIIIINRGRIVAQDTLNDLANRMSGKRRLLLRVRRPGDGLRQGLERLPGVARLEQQADGWVLEVDSQDETLEAIAAHVVEQKAGLLEMRSITMGLEEIFISLTGGEPAPLEGRA